MSPIHRRRSRKTYPKRLAARIYLKAREAGMNPQEAAAQVALGLKHNKHLDDGRYGVQTRTGR
jgi:hypothetical protein